MRDSESPSLARPRHPSVPEREKGPTQRRAKTRTRFEHIVGLQASRQKRMKRMPIVQMEALGAPLGLSKIETGGLGVWCEPDFRRSRRVSSRFFTTRPEMRCLRRRLGALGLRRFEGAARQKSSSFNERWYRCFLPSSRHASSDTIPPVQVGSARLAAAVQTPSSRHLVRFQFS
jgi:hypothetical protein